MYEYKCKVVRVVDGDTVDVDIDLGFGVWLHKERVRIIGMDTPESRTRDKEEKVKGLAAKARLIQILDENENKFILVSHGVGKFGRCLGELFLTSNSDSINNQLVLEGHAKKYNGGKR